MNKAKILVIDPDVKILYAFITLLESEGFRCIAARTHAEALQMLKTEKPAAVFLDVSLPGYSGFEILKDIRRLAADLPVVLITSHFTGKLKTQAAELGISDILEKPLTVAQLRQVLLHLHLTGPHDASTRRPPISPVNDAD